MPIKSETKAANSPKRGLYWWSRQVVFAVTALFFTGFGICQLIGAYRLGDPFSFIMAFFGASLMIMISMVMLLGFIVRMCRATQTGRGIDSSDAST